MQSVFYSAILGLINSIQAPMAMDQVGTSGRLPLISFQMPPPLLEAYSAYRRSIYLGGLPKRAATLSVVRGGEAFVAMLG